MTYAQITLILGLMFSLWVINPVGLPNQASLCFYLRNLPTPPIISLIFADTPQIQNTAQYSERATSSLGAFARSCSITRSCL